MNWYKISQQEELLVLWKLEIYIGSNTLGKAIKNGEPLYVGVMVSEIPDIWTPYKEVPQEHQYTVYVTLNNEFIKENFKSGDYIKSAITMIAQNADVEPLYPLDSELENKLWKVLLISPIDRAYGRPITQGARTLHALLLTE